MIMNVMDNFIKLYFMLGLQQNEILACLAVNHNILISRRTLQRKLNNLNLFRKKHFTNISEVVEFIQENIRIHGQLHGYRWMHLKCLQNNVVVTQETVRILLQILDPEGVDIRSRKRLRRRQYSNKGPNYLWHMDCYDKLKPFGICISGCIDGFSRNIMWLRAGTNSNDPKIIGGYFLETISLIQGCPQTLRADLGTENGIAERIQTSLNSNPNQNTLPPFIYGTSSHNQRIESWWAILRKHHSQYWLNVFHKLKDEGLFSGSFLDKSLIQFCFLNIIQDELDTVATEWNMHRITPSRNSISPNGRPFILYAIPELYNSRDYIQPVQQNAINTCKEICLFVNDFSCDRDIYNMGMTIMREENLALPSHPEEALDLYLTLKRKLSDIL